LNIHKSDLAGILLITPARIGDRRGFFSETYSRRVYADLGIEMEFFQDNHSLSAQANTVRGLHFQAPPHAQAKLVRCVRGAIFDVAVDIRKGSPTYGKWAGYTLSAKNGAQLFVPIGFAHGFATLEPESEIVYKCSDYYAPESECAINWDDPVIDIDWHLSNKAILSGKDADAPLLANLESPFIFEGAA
jgi:dTDP-4-dehydrorhamnose 3,5-epimerase